MNRVEGKVAIVTGAARGMGAMHALRLVQEGARVMLTDMLTNEGAETAESLGANARFMRHDVTNEAQWNKVVAETDKSFGPASILVNNAGIVTYGAIDTLDESLFRRTIDVNLVGVFLGMKAVLPSMKRAGGGAIINISSAAGLVGVPNASAYCASKFAVRGMTKSAAIEFAPFNVRVNSVHPGLIRTAMTSMPESESSVAAAAAATPAGRVGEPLEVANLVLFLASDESRFATGSEFVIDGGISCQ